MMIRAEHASHAGKLFLDRAQYRGRTAVIPFRHDYRWAQPGLAGVFCRPPR